MRRLFVAARFATVGLFNGGEVFVVEPALARSLWHLGLYASARRTATTLKLCAQLTQTATTVLELAAALTRRHDNPRGPMPHAHRRVRRVHALSARARRAKHLDIKIAQVNKYMPRTFGNSFMHIRDFTCFVEHDEPLPEVKAVEISDTEMEIGKYCASLINDGDCLQLGIGGIPNAVCAQLWDKKDLGLHSELVGDGVVDLLEAGIINNKKKNKNPFRTILGAAFGSEKLNNYINNNPSVELHPINYVNNPSVIAQNDNMVSINSCLQIDLLGQVVSDTVGLNQYSAVGGQVDFVRGATMSKGGRSIIAMPSTAKKGL